MRQWGESVLLYLQKIGSKNLENRKLVTGKQSFIVYYINLIEIWVMEVMHTFRTIFECYSLISTLHLSTRYVFERI